MKKFFKKIKEFIIKIINYIKKIFSFAEEDENATTNENQSINEPIDKDNIKFGEIGAYLLYNKELSSITDEFVNAVKGLGINLLYVNTPRKKDNPTTFEEWLDIFNKFENSGIKLMLYIYEAVSMTPKWTNEQIKTITNHPSFYSWVAEDEVTYKSFNTTKAWVKKFYNEKWEDGTRKWPNIAICYLPKLSRLVPDSIGNNYSDYLNLWSQVIDVAHADMYPFISDQTNKSQYNIESDGVPVYGKNEGFGKWFDYLKEHCAFTNNKPNITHRLYIQCCKHTSKDNNDKLYISRPKPTELTIKIQSYANLMSGSNGLMLFLINDLLSDYGKGFTEAAFNDRLEINKDTYNILKNTFNSNVFKNYKNIIVNLKTTDVIWGDEYDLSKFIDNKTNRNDLLISTSENNSYEYCSLLNTSLENDITIIPSDNVKIVNLDELTETSNVFGEEYILKPGNLMLIKKQK